MAAKKKHVKPYTYEVYDLVAETPRMWRWFKDLAANYPRVYGHPMRDGGWVFPSDPHKGKVAEALQAAEIKVVGPVKRGVSVRQRASSWFSRPRRDASGDRSRKRR